MEGIAARDDVLADAGTQAVTPILDALADYRRHGVIRFHMPGHKGGPGAHPLVRKALGEAVFALDVTGVEGMDDLHQPDGLLRRAQELAAAAFGADRSFFLVNGTSAGVQAMILATCRPGDRLIVTRNIHKSILAGIILGGVEPIFVLPETDTGLGIAMGTDPGRIESALGRYPDARAVLLVYPTYYGVTSNLGRIAEVVHAEDKVLLVDEAHGPHFRFHPDLPTPALETGADACAQGMHKILGAMTQASMLHMKGGRVDGERVQAVLRLIQSTSASYILMASLDAARMQMVVEGRELVRRALDLARVLRARVNAISGLRSFGPEILGGPGAHALDPLKVTVTVKELGLSGHQVEMILRHRYRIQVEMSDLFNVLLIVGFGNCEGDCERICAALREIASEPARYREAEIERALRRARDGGALPPLPEPAALPREAFFAHSRPVPIEGVVGRVSAEVVTCYPPGIPILCPGERISAEVVDHLRFLRSSGLRFSGPEDPGLNSLRVL